MKRPFPRPCYPDEAKKEARAACGCSTELLRSHSSLPNQHLSSLCYRQVTAYLHERGVKGYVTLNVLLFDEELERAELTIRAIAASGADAVIIQVHAHHQDS